MSSDHRITQKWPAVIAGSLLITGVLLMMNMIIEESEPGAAPLTLIIVSIGWLIKINHLHKKRSVGTRI